MTRKSRCPTLGVAEGGLQVLDRIGRQWAAIDAEIAVLAPPSSARPRTAARPRGAGRPRARGRRTSSSSSSSSTDPGDGEPPGPPTRRPPFDRPWRPITEAALQRALDGAPDRQLSLDSEARR